MVSKVYLAKRLYPVRHWVLQPSILVLWIVAECLALTSLLLLIVWSQKYFHGYDSWDGGAKEFNYHPLFMTLGLVLIYGNSAICYRIFRYQNKFIMKIIHTCLNTLSFVFAVLGLVAVFDFHNTNNFPNMYSLHSWVGIGTVVLYSCQLVFGFLLFMLKLGNDDLREKYLGLHVYFGGVILGLAVVSCISGITEKLLFSTKIFTYSNFEALGNIGNAFGITVTLFVMVIGFILYNPAYKRVENEHVQME